MTLTIRTLLMLIAAIVFLIATFGVEIRGISLVALGLAIFAFAFVVPDMTLNTRR